MRQQARVGRGMRAVEQRPGARLRNRRTLDINRRRRQGGLLSRRQAQRELMQATASSELTQRKGRLAMRPSIRPMTNTHFSLSLTISPSSSLSIRPDINQAISLSTIPSSTIPSRSRMDRAAMAIRIQGQLWGLLPIQVLMPPIRLLGIRQRDIRPIQRVRCPTREHPWVRTQLG